MVCNCTLHNIGCVCCAMKNVLYPGQYLTTWYSITRYRAVPGPLPSVQCAACSAERERGSAGGARWRRCHWSTPGRAWPLSVSHCTVHTLHSTVATFSFNTRSDQPLLTLSLTVNLILFYKYFVHLLSLHSLSLQTQFSSACFVKPCKENMSCIWTHCYWYAINHDFSYMQNLRKIYSQDHFSGRCGKMYRPLVCDHIVPTTHHRQVY